MPEREISLEQYKEIIRWIHQNNWTTILETVRDGGTARFRTVEYRDVFRAFNVGGEPIIIYEKGTRTRTSVDPVDPGVISTTCESCVLVCSDNHARELEEARIVNFSEKPEPTK